jgi:hypothetical protein
MLILLHHRKSYVFGMTSAFVLFSTVSLITALPLMQAIITGPGALSGKTILFLRLVMPVLFQPQSSGFYYTLTVSLLVGLNVGLLTEYYIRFARFPRKHLLATHLLGTFGVMASFGCATCGLFFATTLLTAVGGGAAATFLPNEYMFSFIGLGLLLFSIITTVRALQQPIIC